MVKTPFNERIYERVYTDRDDVSWWLFSKIDEHLDDICIPYYDPDINLIRNFKPDFIFWFQKSNNYKIVFVDPKGIVHNQYEHKVDWFERFFVRNNKPKVFEYNKMLISVLLLLVAEDRNRLSEKYRTYWLDDVSSIFNLAAKGLQND